jgi:hypothetical protein
MLLARYLPPIPEGIAASYLNSNLGHGSWILDPFGAAPNMVVEAARAGYRVLVAANNPISRFLVEVAACPPTESELQSALAELSAARKGDERLEPYVRSLYATSCAECNQSIEADAFLWEREALAPYARIYQCPYCNDSGERPVTQDDVSRVRELSAGGLHRARALERIVSVGDPDRIHAEEALTAYLPRSIYALTTLVNRLEVLLTDLPSREDCNDFHRRSLIALALVAFDQGNILWSHQTDRPRPRQLTASPHFRENNLWFALERAPGSIALNPDPVPVTYWPNSPPGSGGIMLFEGPMRELAAAIEAMAPSDRIPIDTVVTALPRPNQAFWTLSALWAGWLWGRAEVSRFITVLRRRRYDWAWHCSALSSVFNSLNRLVTGKSKVFACIGENEAGFLSATLLAAQSAGFDLIGLAIRDEWDLAQVQWQSQIRAHPSGAHPLNASSRSRMKKSIIASAKSHLIGRGEPAPYIYLHASALSVICSDAMIAQELPSPPGDVYSQVHPMIEELFTPENGFIKLGGGEKTVGTGSFWHDEIAHSETPLADRVEIDLVSLLLENQETTLPEIDERVCKSFPGLFTPEYSFVDVCLDSYTERNAENPRVYLRREDAQNMRRSELDAIHFELSELGARLGFRPVGDQPLLWMAEDEQVKLALYILASAVIGEVILSNPFPAEISLIVLPGARAKIVMHKIRNNPLLRQEIEKGWRFLKYRHLRHLLETPTLTRDNLDELLSLDPLTESPAQMRLL